MELHSESLERTLLSALMMADDETWDSVEKTISQSDFYYPNHRDIYGAMESLRADGEPTELVHVACKLNEKAKGERWAGYLSEISSSGGLVSQSESYARKIRDLSLRRAVQQRASQIMQDAADVSVPIEETINKRLSLLSDAFVDSRSSMSFFMSDKISEFVRESESAASGRVAKPKIPSGFSRLDSSSNGGFSGGDYIIIGARPSVGKSAFAISMALNMAKSGARVALFSLEMSADSVVKRVVSSLSKVPAGMVARMSLCPYDRRNIARKSIEAYEMGKNLILVDSPNMSLSALKAKARQLKRQSGIECIIVDYIGIVSLIGEEGIRKDAPRFEQVGFVSKSLKALARELDIPVVALCQVNRDSEDKEPTLSNLRDSGSIEQDADIVAFLHRRRSGEDIDEETGIIGTKLTVAKSRNGETGAGYVAFIPAIASFMDAI